MATQRLLIATVGGEAVFGVAKQFRLWSDSPDPVAIDQFCEQIRQHATSFPIIYYAEWIDRWSMGDHVPGPYTVDGQRFQAACFSRAEAVSWANNLPSQHQENDWLKARLCEAASAWRIVDRVVIVVVREVLGGSVTDEEVRGSLEPVPTWLLLENPSQ